ncbi:ribosomal protein S18-alanine N-acetyltransferase [Enterococcus sp. LJL51]|uniref:ribosomal protein S18-alanine N-acetyltransferase n=1 Tax=Enterococcus sp. LJL51 TaxID=3416656 RepID=UPI003CEFCFCC
MRVTLKKFESLRRLFKKKSNWQAFDRKTVTIEDKEYTVRGIVESDIKDLLTIEREVYNGELPWTRSAFLSEIHSKNPHLYILILKEEKTVGFIGCRVIEHDGHITNVAVGKSAQGQGIGSYLLNEAIQFASAQGCTQMSLEVKLINKHAQSVYRKIGFTSSKITEGYYDDGEDALEMILDLSNG